MTREGGDGNDVLNGGAGNDILEGGVGDDILNGNAGADRMLGGQGDDSYFVDNAKDKVIEKDGEGAEDIVYSTVTYALTGTFVENAILMGKGNLNLTGNTLDNGLMGNRGNNRLDGGVGNDTLEGGAGDDVLYGGAGDDVLVGDFIPDMKGASPSGSIYSWQAVTMFCTVAQVMIYCSAEAVRMF